MKLTRYSFACVLVATVVAAILVPTSAVNGLGTALVVSDPDSYACDLGSYIDFEQFDDGDDLSSRTFPGVRFTTTDGFDWRVGDFSTGAYNGKYPSGQYTSQGSKWAWLGEAQGRGRIDLSRPASTFSLLVSSNTPVFLNAYSSNGTLLDDAVAVSGNTSTGTMIELRVTLSTPSIDYLEIHDSGNFFLIDSICTDALGAIPRNDPRNVPIPFSIESDFWDWPDRDGDGIPDKWEVDGVWVNGAHLDLPALGADPDHKDLFIWVDSVHPSYADPGVREHIRRTFHGAGLSNPDGRNGVNVHFEIGNLNLGSEFGQATSSSDVSRVLRQSAINTGYIGDPRAGDASVPPIFKYLLFGESIGGASGLALGIPGSAAMVAVSDTDLDLIGHLVWRTGRHWPGESRAFIRAVVATHELGHLLGLGHHGNRHQPNNNPEYKSVMSYAYSVFGLPPGFGRVANTIDYARTGSSDPDSMFPETNLDWRLGAELGSLQFIQGQHGERGENFYFEWIEGEFRSWDPDSLVEEESLAGQLDSADPVSLDAFRSHFAGSAPQANDDSYTSTVGTQLVVKSPGILANDDVNDATLMNSTVLTTAGGTSEISPDGSFTYDPAPGFTGEDTFSYTLSNESGSDTAEVTINVQVEVDAGGETTPAAEEPTDSAEPSISQVDGLEAPGPAQYGRSGRLPATGSGWTVALLSSGLAFLLAGAALEALRRRSSLARSCDAAGRR